MALPDGKFLQHVSTSPLREPPHFVDDMRKGYRWVLEEAKEGADVVPNAVFQFSQVQFSSVVTRGRCNFPYEP